MPKISIVIPAYNVGDYLQECLDSVRNQTFSDIEAIVVNDASPDNVEEIAVQAAEQDPRIRVVTNNPNMGTHRTRMAGVENASGVSCKGSGKRRISALLLPLFTQV